MKKFLNHLASHLNTLGLKAEAKIISNLYRSDRLLFGKKGQVSDKIFIDSLQVELDLSSHPLGKRIKDFCLKIAQMFRLDNPQKNSFISVKEMDDIIDEFKKYNYDLSLAETHWSQNSSLIYPQVADKIIKTIASFVYHQSDFQIKFQEYNEFIENLSEMYADFYVEDYLGTVRFHELDYAKKMDDWRDANPQVMNPKVKKYYDSLEEQESRNDSSLDVTRIYDEVDPTKEYA